MTYVCFQIVRDIECELFLNASNRGEYYHLACAMAVELGKEMSKKKSPSGLATEQESPKTKEVETMYAISERCNVKKSVKETPLQLRFDKILENVLHELRIRFGFKLQVSNLDKQSGLLYTGKCADLDKQKQMNWPEPLLKQEYGEFDMESPMESGDPKQRYTRCSKTKEHEKMILFADFSITHLPENLRSNTLFEFIWVFAMITVRIEINTISDDRPKQIPGTEIDYPCSGAFESTPTHGTGRICNVTKHSADNHKFSKFKVCPCERCKSSGHPSKEWGEILIFTAAHVVHDNSEAGKTRCRLFYHSEDDSSEEKYLVGVNVVERDIERDWCRFKCVTCDMDLVEKLESLLSSFFRLWYEVFQENRADSKKHRFTIIVSHPHGYLKRLSLGRWTKRFGAKDVQVPYHSLYHYDAPTCGGSSGATVHFLGKSGGNMHWFDQHIHSGCYGPMRKQSGVGWENKF
ncbi:uncharacterized protein LOC106058367 isoform X2 [Biomphalaria glabrata]|nr:uncharacterized protein LOC106058367 isoform X2 [Biomphalaria glabrata]XP_055898247.1 uncharacterized protein LOC106058367 isoform X2 [Biomphalaria glabrata]